MAAAVISTRPSGDSSVGGCTTDPGFVVHEISLLRLRALLARARQDEASYLDYRDRYRAMATHWHSKGK